MRVPREPPGTPAYWAKALEKPYLEHLFKEDEFKTEPMHHQYQALALGTLHDSFLFALDMGVGKTKLALDLATVHRRVSHGGQVLVTCPPIVVLHWEAEVKKHSDFSVAVATGTKKQKMNVLLNSQADIVVVSHPWIVSALATSVRKGDEQEIEAFEEALARFAQLVIDECHHIRSPDSVGFKMYRKFLLQIPYRYLLTGSPVGNFETGVWALYYCIDKGETFGENFDEFIVEWFNQQMIQNRWVRYSLKKKKADEYYEKFWTKAVRWESEECTDLPEVSHMVLRLEMSNPQKKAYQELVDSGGKDKELTAKAMKITAGIDYKSSPKLEALTAIVEEVCVDMKEQLIVWCWLTSENTYLQESLQKKFKKLKVGSIYGATKDSDKRNLLNSWANGKLDILVANVKSLGIGVNLFESRTCVFFSNSTSITDRKQAEKRIHRVGQTHLCNYVDLVAVNTVDELNLQILERADGRFSKLMGDRTNITPEILRKQRNGISKNSPH